VSEKFDQMDAEAEAKRVLGNFKNEALATDPFGIADQVGITVKPKDSSEPGVSGFLMRVGNQFGIQYARHLANQGFIRFTVSHELGHYFLPGHPEHLFPSGTGVHESRSGFISSDRYERQADHFAAALLMPETPFKSEMNKAGDGLAAIETLSNLFQTSMTATAIRFAKYAEGAVAVVMSSGKRIEYCIMSELLKSAHGIAWIPKGEFLSRTTPTARFNENAAFVEQAKKVEGCSLLSEWFDGAPEIEMNEDVIGLGSYGKTLTVLYTDQDIEGELGSDDDE
jgi:hypothetical protein